MHPDVIVIGAGAAGCVLASRLSADPACNVLLIEAGGSDWNPVFRVPIMAGVLLRQRYGNWLSHTEAELQLDGRRNPVAARQGGRRLHQHQRNDLAPGPPFGL